MLPLHPGPNSGPNSGRTILAAAVIALATLALGGCDSVALEGKLFDWAGISGSALDEKRADPKMADRAPLVVPPSVTRLPEPGSGKSGGDAVAALNDPELKKAAAAKERDKLHQAYCRGDIKWKDKAFDAEYGGASRSPYGPCGLFSLNNLTK
jgi:hypothetical protein